MKRFIAALAFGLMAIAAQAEATFDQVEGLIQQKQYQVAILALEEIVQNHPKSSKAFYAMAQAQAGVGNLAKAQLALDKAQALNPSLDFAPASSVASLRQAITPQVTKIETIETSHFWRNFLMGFILFAGGGLILALYIQKKNKEEEAAEAEAQAKRDAKYARQREEARQAREALDKAEAERKAKIEAAEAALKAHKNYGKPGFDPANPDKLKSKAQLKKEADELAAAAALREAQARADAAEADARAARLRATYNVGSQSASAPTVTHVHQNSGSNDMLTGVLIGNMISNSGHHHDTERTVIRETVREVEVPAKAPKSSWDDIDTSSSSRSSSWDDSSSSSSRSSSWDSGSSSSSSSSWSSSSSSDSGSSWSSSDSSSSSSWD